MERENTVFQEELNPTFLFMWKGTRVEDEPNYHCHEHLELCYIQSGTGKHRIGDTIYEVKEGDLLVINEGVYHQSLAGEHKTPVAEFYVGLTDLNLYDFSPSQKTMVSDNIKYITFRDTYGGDMEDGLAWELLRQ